MEVCLCVPPPLRAAKLALPCACMHAGRWAPTRSRAASMHPPGHVPQACTHQVTCRKHAPTRSRAASRSSFSSPYTTAAPNAGPTRMVGMRSAGGEAGHKKPSHLVFWPSAPRGLPGQGTVVCRLWQLTSKAAHLLLGPFCTSVSIWPGSQVPRSWRGGRPPAYGYV